MPRPGLDVVIESLNFKGVIRPIWVCRDCGARGAGEAMSVDRPADLDTPLRSQLSGWTYSRNMIPVGWASYGSDGVRCPKCII